MKPAAPVTSTRSFLASRSRSSSSRVSRIKLVHSNARAELETRSVVPRQFQFASSKITVTMPSTATSREPERRPVMAAARYAGKRETLERRRKRRSDLVQDLTCICKSPTRVISCRMIKVHPKVSHTWKAWNRSRKRQKLFNFKKATQQANSRVSARCALYTSCYLSRSKNRPSDDKIA